jgi:hypothetical protein
MASKKFLMGMLVMALVFEMAAADCENGSTSGGKTDPALNGTWVSSSGDELKFNNGNFEISDGGIPIAKGTYTTNYNSITITVTHVHGGQFEGTLESKWYTKAEIIALPFRVFMFDIFVTEITYSVSGNTLNLEGYVLTRK